MRQVEHHLRQPARRARRPRPAGQRLEAGRRQAAARSSPRCAAPPPTPCRRSATSTRSSRRRGAANDLVELTRLQPPLAKAGGRLRLARLRPRPRTPTTSPGAPDDNYTQGAFGESVCALHNGLPQLSFFRAYTPELVGWFDDFGHSGFIDAIGGIGRIGPPSTPSASRPRRLRRTWPTRSTARRADRLGPRHRQHPALPGRQRAPVNDIDPSDDSVPFTDGGASPTAAPATATRPRCRPAHEADRPHRSPCSPPPSAWLADSPAPTTPTPTRSRCTTRSGSSRAPTCGSPASTRARSPASTSRRRSAPSSRSSSPGRSACSARTRSCSSEPQSLIAEYFIDLRPEGPPLARRRTRSRPATSQQTVQNDLVQNTLREPFKRAPAAADQRVRHRARRQPDSLNEAIRLGAPALSQLQQGHCDILATRTAIIRDLNVELRQGHRQARRRREDVVRFIQKARDTAAASAARRDDLSQDFDLLDDFLASCSRPWPSSATLAVQQTPLLATCAPPRPGSTRLALNLPAFNDATESLADEPRRAPRSSASKALRRGQRRDPGQLARVRQEGAATAEMLADFLRRHRRPAAARSRSTTGSTDS